MKELPSCLFLFILMDTIELGSGGISKARKILVGDIYPGMGIFFSFFPLEEKDALKNKSGSRRLTQLLFFLLLN